MIKTKLLAIFFVLHIMPGSLALSAREYFWDPETCELGKECNEFPGDPDDLLQDNKAGGPCFQYSSNAEPGPNGTFAGFERYYGKKSTTVTGIPCQKWTEVDGYEAFGYNNYCRVTTKYRAPWCWTTNATIAWAYCFPPCEDFGCVRQLNDGSVCTETKTPLCMADSTGYPGVAQKDDFAKKNSTYDGRVCQKWSEQEPNEHTYGILGDNNICASIDEDAPYCYAADDDDWYYCYPTCRAEEDCIRKLDNGTVCAEHNRPPCKGDLTGHVPGLGYDYGKKNTTIDGDLCKNWLLSTDYPYLGDSNYCSAAGEKSPWCYTNTGWDYCFPACPLQCLHKLRKGGACADEGEDQCDPLPAGDYIGKIEYGNKNTTREGIPCENWLAADYPSQVGHNECISTDADAPWCYTDPAKNWNYCFPECEDDDNLIID